MTASISTVPAKIPAVTFQKMILRSDFLKDCLKLPVSALNCSDSVRYSSTDFFKPMTCISVSCCIRVKRSNCSHVNNKGEGNEGKDTDDCAREKPAPKASHPKKRMIAEKIARLMIAPHSPRPS